MAEVHTVCLLAVVPSGLDRQPLQHRVHDAFQHFGAFGVIPHVLREDAVVDAVMLKHLLVI